MHCSYLTKGEEIIYAGDYEQSTSGGLALVFATGVVIGVDTSSAFAQGYKTNTPTYVVGPVGSGTTYFSGSATYGPDNLHLCTESSYDLARFGPVSFCASDVPLVKLIVEASAACLFGGVGIVDVASWQRSGSACSYLAQVCSYTCGGDPRGVGPSPRVTDLTASTRARLIGSNGRAYCSVAMLCVYSSCGCAL